MIQVYNSLDSQGWQAAGPRYSQLNYCLLDTRNEMSGSFSKGSAPDNVVHEEIKRPGSLEKGDADQRTESDVKAEEPYHFTQGKLLAIIVCPSSASSAEVSKTSETNLGHRACGSAIWQISSTKSCVRMRRPESMRRSVSRNARGHGRLLTITDTHPRSGQILCLGRIDGALHLCHPVTAGRLPE